MAFFLPTDLSLSTKLIIFISLIAGNLLLYLYTTIKEYNKLDNNYEKLNLEYDTLVNSTNELKKKELKNLDLQSQLKLKNADLFYKKKSDAYQKYCTSAQSHIQGWLNSQDDDKNEDKSEYLKVHQLAYLMSDDTIRCFLDKLNSYYFKNSYTDTEIDTLFSNIVKAMNDDLAHYRNNI